MTDREKLQQILHAAALFRKGDLATGIQQILGATQGKLKSSLKGPDPKSLLEALGPFAPLPLVVATSSTAGPHVPLPLVVATSSFAGYPPLAQVAAPPEISPFVGGQAAAFSIGASQVLGNTLIALPGALDTGLSFVDQQPLTQAQVAMHFPDAADFDAPVGARGTSVALSFAEAQGPSSTALALLGGVANGFQGAPVHDAAAAAALRMQEAAQQQYLEAYQQQLKEIEEKQQEAAQLALIMQAAEAQAEYSKHTLEDSEDYHRHRRGSREGEKSDSKKEGTRSVRAHEDTMRHNFKTSLCKLFAQSPEACRHGTNCMYAHGPEDLRAPGMKLSREEDMMVKRVATGGGHGFKTSLCKLFAMGRCSHGKSCVFAHGASDVRAFGSSLSDREESILKKVTSKSKGSGTEKIPTEQEIANWTMKASMPIPPPPPGLPPGMFAPGAAGSGVDDIILQATWAAQLAAAQFAGLAGLPQFSSLNGQLLDPSAAAAASVAATAAAAAVVPQLAPPPPPAGALTPCLAPALQASSMPIGCPVPAPDSKAAGDHGNGLASTHPQLSPLALSLLAQSEQKLADDGAKRARIAP